MGRGKTYARKTRSASMRKASIAMRSGRSRHHARRYGPAGVDNFGSPRWSAMTAETIGARAMSGGGTDAGVEETIRHGPEQICENGGDGGGEERPPAPPKGLRKDRRRPDAPP